MATNSHVIGESVGPQSRGLVAYGIRPHPGGTTMFYRNLAAGLRERGWTVYGVYAGTRPAEPDFSDEWTVRLSPESDELEHQVVAFLRWVQEQRVNIVIPMSQDFIHAAVRHLPERVRLCVRVSSTTRGAYVQAAPHKQRAAKITVASPRQRDDLIRYWKVRPELVEVIPHGIPLDRFLMCPLRTARDNGRLTVGYLGRLEDADKGVLFLPDIFCGIGGLDASIQFVVAGDGPSRDALEKRLVRRKIRHRVDMLGRVSPNEVPKVLSAIDVFVMPSRFEGFGFSLVEAMAAGCVPVAHRIRGVTDCIIKDGENGFLCAVGHTKAFEAAVLRLMHQPDLIASMSRAARNSVAPRFALEKMVDRYERTFTEMMRPEYGNVAPAPAPLEDIQLPRLLQPTWRTKVPQPVKNLVRRWSEHLLHRAC